MIEEIVGKCLDLAEVKTMLEHIANVKEDVEEKLLSPYWLTRFECLDKMCDATDLDEQLTSNVKGVTECLRPLKV